MFWKYIYWIWFAVAAAIFPHDHPHLVQAEETQDVSLSYKTDSLFIDAIVASSDYSFQEANIRCFNTGNKHVS